jgi:hypothetical protein
LPATGVAVEALRAQVRREDRFAKSARIHLCVIDVSGVIFSTFHPRQLSYTMFGGGHERDGRPIVAL